MSDMIAENADCRGTVPTLYYDDIGPQSRSCILLIKMFGVDVNLQRINMRNGENISASYRKIVPSCIVPTIVDGKCILSHGHKIMIYLCDKYSGDSTDHLFPSEHTAREKVLNVLFCECAGLNQCYNQLVTEILSKTYAKIDKNYHYVKVTSYYNFLDSRLKSQLFFLGHDMTIVDLSILTTLSGLDLIFPILKDPWQDLYRWFENFKSMDYYQYNEEGLEKLCKILEVDGGFIPISRHTKITSAVALNICNSPKENTESFPSVNSTANELEFSENDTNTILKPSVENIQNILTSDNTDSEMEVPERKDELEEIENLEEYDLDKNIAAKEMELSKNDFKSIQKMPMDNIEPEAESEPKMDAGDVAAKELKFSENDKTIVMEFPKYLFTITSNKSISHSSKSEFDMQIEHAIESEYEKKSVEETENSEKRKDLKDYLHEKTECNCFTVTLTFDTPEINRMCTQKSTKLLSMNENIKAPILCTPKNSSTVTCVPSDPLKPSKNDCQFNFCCIGSCVEVRLYYTDLNPKPMPLSQNKVKYVKCENKDEIDNEPNVDIDNQSSCCFTCSMGALRECISCIHLEDCSCDGNNNGNCKYHNNDLNNDGYFVCCCQNGNWDSGEIFCCCDADKKNYTNCKNTTESDDLQEKPLCNSHGNVQKCSICVGYNVHIKTADEKEFSTKEVYQDKAANTISLGYAGNGISEDRKPGENMDSTQNLTFDTAQTNQAGDKTVGPLVDLKDKYMGSTENLTSKTAQKTQAGDKKIGTLLYLNDKYMNSTQNLTMDTAKTNASEDKNFGPLVLLKNKDLKNATNISSSPKVLSKKDIYNNMDTMQQLPKLPEDLSVKKQLRTSQSQGKENHNVMKTDHDNINPNKETIAARKNYISNNKKYEITKLQDVKNNSKPTMGERVGGVEVKQVKNINILNINKNQYITRKPSCPRNFEVQGLQPSFGMAICCQTNMSCGYNNTPAIHENCQGHNSCILSHTTQPGTNCLQVGTCEAFCPLNTYCVAKTVTKRCRRLKAGSSLLKTKFLQLYNSPYPIQQKIPLQSTSLTDLNHPTSNGSQKKTTNVRDFRNLSSTKRLQPLYSNAKQPHTCNKCSVCEKYLKSKSLKKRNENNAPTALKENQDEHNSLLSPNAYDYNSSITLNEYPEEYNSLKSNFVPFKSLMKSLDNLSVISESLSQFSSDKTTQTQERKTDFETETEMNIFSYGYNSRIDKSLSLTNFNNSQDNLNFNGTQREIGLQVSSEALSERESYMHLRSGDESSTNLLSPNENNSRDSRLYEEKDVYPSQASQKQKHKTDYDNHRDKHFRKPQLNNEALPENERSKVLVNSMHPQNGNEFSTKLLSPNEYDYNSVRTKNKTRPENNSRISPYEKEDGYNSPRTQNENRDENISHIYKSVSFTTLNKSQDNPNFIASQREIGLQTEERSTDYDNNQDKHYHILQKNSEAFPEKEESEVLVNYMHLRNGNEYNTKVLTPNEYDYSSYRTRNESRDENNSPINKHKEDDGYNSRRTLNEKRNEHKSDIVNSVSPALLNKSHQDNFSAIRSQQTQTRHTENENNRDKLSQEALVEKKRFKIEKNSMNLRNFSNSKRFQALYSRFSIAQQPHICNKCAVCEKYLKSKSLKERDEYNLSRTPNKNRDEKNSLISTSLTFLNKSEDYSNFIRSVREIGNDNGSQTQERDMDNENDQNGHIRKPQINNEALPKKQSSEVTVHSMHLRSGNEYNTKLLSPNEYEYSSSRTPNKKRSPEYKSNWEQQAVKSKSKTFTQKKTNNGISKVPEKGHPNMITTAYNNVNNPAPVQGQLTSLQNQKVKWRDRSVDTTMKHALSDRMYPYKRNSSSSYRNGKSIQNPVTRARGGLTAQNSDETKSDTRLEPNCCACKMTETSKSVATNSAEDETLYFLCNLSTSSEDSLRQEDPVASTSGRNSKEYSKEYTETHSCSCEKLEKYVETDKPHLTTTRIDNSKDEDNCCCCNEDFYDKDELSNNKECSKPVMLNVSTQTSGTENRNLRYKCCEIKGNNVQLKCKCGSDKRKNTSDNYESKRKNPTEYDAKKELTSNHNKQETERSREITTGEKKYFIKQDVTTVRQDMKMMKTSIRNSTSKPTSDKQRESVQKETAEIEEIKNHSDIIRNSEKSVRGSIEQENVVKATNNNSEMTNIGQNEKYAYKCMCGRIICCQYGENRRSKMCLNIALQTCCTTQTNDDKKQKKTGEGTTEPMQSSEEKTQSSVESVKNEHSPKISGKQMPRRSELTEKRGSNNMEMSHKIPTVNIGTKIEKAKKQELTTVENQKIQEGKTTDEDRRKSVQSSEGETSKDKKQTMLGEKTRESQQSSEKKPYSGKIKEKIQPSKALQQKRPSEETKESVQKREEKSRTSVKSVKNGENRHPNIGLLKCCTPKTCIAMKQKMTAESVQSSKEISQTSLESLKKYENRESNSSRQSRESLQSNKEKPRKSLEPVKKEENRGPNTGRPGGESLQSNKEKPQSTLKSVKKEENRGPNTERQRKGSVQSNKEKLRTSSESVKKEKNRGPNTGRQARELLQCNDEEPQTSLESEKKEKSSESNTGEQTGESLQITQSPLKSVTKEDSITARKLKKSKQVTPQLLKPANESAKCIEPQTKKVTSLSQKKPKENELPKSENSEKEANLNLDDDFIKDFNLDLSSISGSCEVFVVSKHTRILNCNGCEKVEEKRLVIKNNSDTDFEKSLPPEIPEPGMEIIKTCKQVNDKICTITITRGKKIVPRPEENKEN